MANQDSGNSDISLARKKLRSRDVSGAIQILQEVTQRSPNDSRATELLGMCLFTAKDFESAKTVFEKVTRLNPQLVSGWINLGATQNVLQDFTGASKSLRKALKCNRKSASAYYNLGIAQKGLKMNSNAVSAYQEAIHIDPKLAEAYANLANLFIDMKNNKQATRTLEAGLKECPDDRKLAVLLKKVQGMTDDAKRAVAPLGRLVNEEELAKKQVRTAKRDLTSSERTAERTLLKTHSKEIRDRLPELISLLDHDLTQQIHFLHLAALRRDERGEAIHSYEEMAETMSIFDHWRQETQNTTSEMRSHLQRTDPGL